MQARARKHTHTFLKKTARQISRKMKTQFGTQLCVCVHVHGCIYVCACGWLCMCVCLSLAGSLGAFSLHVLQGLLLDRLDALWRAVLLLVFQVALEEEFDLLHRHAQVDHTVKQCPAENGKRKLRVHNYINVL